MKNIGVAMLFCHSAISRLFLSINDKVSAGSIMPTIITSGMYSSSRQGTLTQMKNKGAEVQFRPSMKLRSFSLRNYNRSVYPNQEESKLTSLCLLFIFLVIISCPIHLLGQVLSSGQVNGTVTDSAGEVIAGAAVILRNQLTGVEQKMITNSTGYYVIRGVQPGQYVMTVSKGGFKTTSLPSFVITVGQILNENETLDIGAASQTVEVSAAAEGVLLQKSSSELGLVVGQKEVVSLPLNGRNFTELLTLTPGVTPISTSQVATGGIAEPAIPNSEFVNPSIFGQQNRSTIYLLDGINDTNFRFGLYSILPIIDATAEFKVQSHNDNAEFGGALGGIVNMVSKSGTNQFHGDAWDFNRSNFGQARNPFTDFCSPARCGPSASNTTPAAPEHFLQNEYGGTLGGPILKNKIFFFGAYEGWHYVKPVGAQELVPTAAEESGDFSNAYYSQQIYNPYSTTCSGGTCTVTPFECDPAGNPIAVLNGSQSGGTPCNKIPTSLINGATEALLTNYVLAPNAPSGPQNSYNYIDSRPTTSVNNTWQIRLDEDLSAKDFGFFRLSQEWWDTTSPESGANSISASYYVLSDYGGGWTHMFSQNLSLEGHFGMMPQRTHDDPFSAPNGYAPMTEAGLDVTAYQGLVFGLSAPYSVSSAGNAPELAQHGGQPNFGGGGSISWLHGRHSMKAGMEYLYLKNTGADDWQTASFSDAATSDINAVNTGNSLASMLLGLPSNYIAYSPTLGLTSFSWSTWSGYIQDSWRIKSNLTLNMGLRYDYQETIHPLTNFMPNNLLDLFGQKYVIGRSSVPACTTTFASPCLPIPLASIPFSSHIIYGGNFPLIGLAVKDNIQPRLGFAWQLRPKTVLRGGYGIVYDQNNGRTQDTGNEFGSATWPWTTGIGPYQYNIPTNGIWPGGPGNPLVNLTSILGATGPSALATSPWPTLNGYFESPHFTDPRSQQYNLQIEQLLSPTTMLMIGYAGSKDDRLVYDGYANAARTPSPLGTPLTTIDSLKLMPWVPPTLNYQQSTGTSNYNALITSLERRLSQSFTTIVAFTWSKSMDQNSGLFGAENGAGGGSTVQNFFDPHNAYGPSSFNVPIMFSWAALYQLPFGPGQRWLRQGLPAYVAGGWTVGYIFTSHTGQNYNLSVNGDPANISGDNGTVSGYSRPNVIGNPLVGTCNGVAIGKKGPNGYCLYNPSAFATPSGSFGNMGRNTLHGPEYNNVDLSVMKEIPVHGSLSLQIRADAYNALNIQVPSVPNTTTNQSGAGFSTSIASTPRQFQFAGKVIF